MRDVLKERRERDSNPRGTFAPSGFQDRRGIGSNSIEGKAITPAQEGVVSSVVSSDPALDALIAVWPTLPEHVRQTIVSIVNSTSKGGK